MAPSVGPATNTMIRGTRLNRIASFLTLAVMALAIALGANALQAARDDAEIPSDGILVVANLRAESLTFHYLAARRGAVTLALPGPPHEFAELGGRLYVTLGRAGAIAEVDPRGPAVLRVLPLAGEPHGIAVRGGELLVTLDETAEVVTLNPETLAVMGRVATGNTPHTVAVDGTTGQAYVTDSRDNRLRLLETGATVETGLLPESVTIAGEVVLTANAEGGTVSLFTLSTLKLARHVEVGAGPVRVTRLTDKRALVAVTGEDRLAIVNVTSGKVEKRITTAARPDGICVSPKGTHVAVAANGADSVRILQVDGWYAAGDLEAGAGPGSCAWLEGR